MVELRYWSWSRAISPAVDTVSKRLIRLARPGKLQYYLNIAQYVKIAGT